MDRIKRFVCKRCPRTLTRDTWIENMAYGMGRLSLEIDCMEDAGPLCKNCLDDFALRYHEDAADAAYLAAYPARLKKFEDDLRAELQMARRAGPAEYNRELKRQETMSVLRPKTLEEVKRIREKSGYYELTKETKLNHLRRGRLLENPVPKSRLAK